jgi:hypothetical protein
LEVFDKNRLVVFTNDFFTVYQDTVTSQMNISLNEIVQTSEEQKRTEALGEKLFTLLKDRPRHRALLTNECKLNHSMYLTNLTNIVYENQYSYNNNQQQQQQIANLSNQEDETFYTRELIHIYGQPIVPSFHKHFNYQLSNTHYGYRTLRRLLNCDILKKYVKITKEEIKSLDRVVEFVQLTNDKCLSAFQLNITTFFDPARFENGIVKNWLDVWYVQRLKEKYSTSTIDNNNIENQQPTTNNGWSEKPPKSPKNNCFLHTSHFDHELTECDQANHLWFCLHDYKCQKIEQFMNKLKDYLCVRNNRSELILVHTIHPVFEYRHVLSETRRILAMFLNKLTATTSTATTSSGTSSPTFQSLDNNGLLLTPINKTLKEVINKNIPFIAVEHIENLLSKFINVSVLIFNLLK